MPKKKRTALQSIMDVLLLASCAALWQAAYAGSFHSADEDTPELLPCIYSGLADSGMAFLATLWRFCWQYKHEEVDRKAIKPFLQSSAINFVAFAIIAAMWQPTAFAGEWVGEAVGGVVGRDISGGVAIFLVNLAGAWLANKLPNNKQLEASGMSPLTFALAEAGFFCSGPADLKGSKTGTRSALYAFLFAGSGAAIAETASHAMAWCKKKPARIADAPATQPLLEGQTPEV